MRLLYAQAYRIGDYHRRHGWRGVRWLACRRPSNLWQLVGASIVARLSGWEADHVLVDDGEVVLDYAFTKTRYWPSLAVGWSHQIVGEQRIRCLARLDLSAFEGRTDSGGWIHLLLVTCCYWLLWLSAGRIRLRTDCVSIAKQCLRQVGIDVPRWVWLPSHLRDFLHETGHVYHSTHRLVVVGDPPPNVS